MKVATYEPGHLGIRPYAEIILSRKTLWPVITLLIVTAMFGCKKNSGQQVMDHVPISESEYQDILDMELPDDGPLQYEKLIYRNSINYYTLTSSTGSDLHSEIGGKGPSSICKDCSWAYTWDFIWKWDTNEGDGLCSAKWINAKVFFDYHVPLWIREQEMSLQFRQRYSTWMKEIWTNINQRTVIVLQETALLERNIMALPKQDCAALDRRIKAEGTLTTARINTGLDALASGGSRDWMLDF